MTDSTPEAGPSNSQLRPAETSYHATSQFRHWRYSPSQLQSVREQLNGKCVEVVARNQALEKEAQMSLGHEFTDPPSASAYLSVSDELDLLHFYVSQASKICRSGFGLPEVVESTAISYLKRFYLKNSVMEWHPKVIMPTCLFLAAKTTNYPVPVDIFVSKIAKLKQADVLDTEFLVAQSLQFEFWVRGAEKAVRGWALELQEQPKPKNVDEVQKALPRVLEKLGRSRMTDVEFVYTPGQIALACWYAAAESLVREFLDWRYESYSPADLTATMADERLGDAEADEPEPAAAAPYGMAKDRLLEIIASIAGTIAAVTDTPLPKIKDIDKRLKGCTNPEKVPGTALYIKRKQENEAAEAASRAAKALKSAQAMADRDSVFGDVIPQPTKDSVRKPLSPRLTVPSTERRPPTPSGLKEVVAQRGKVDRAGGAGTGERDGAMEPNGMGIRDEAMGMLVGGEGLKHVAKELDSD